MKPADIASQAQSIVTEVEKVIVGKHDTIQKALISMLCRGHVLLEDIPGVGKTTLAKALAKTVGGDFRRVQFTPDLLPSDITGSSVFNQKTSEFEFRPGPVFANVVLVDEINRATPKTQSALLEAMEEYQVSADGFTHQLPKPFFVIATQNSVEMTGTYPLPEAQMDRFFMRLSLGYPSKGDEVKVLEDQKTVHPLEGIGQVISLEALLGMQEAVREIHVADSIRNYIVDIVRATRENNQLLMGASPRGSLHLMRAAQANAAVQGFDFVKPDDVKAVASGVLGHRVMARADTRMQVGGSESVIERILQQVVAPVPSSR